MLTSPRETTLCRYHYDPLDRQAGCTLTLLQPAVIQRFYCKSRLATEVQGAVRTSLFQHDDQLLAQQRHQNSKLDTTLLATDQQRSVLNALDTTRPHPLAYTPYGHRTAESGLLSLLGFNGERPDPVTGHYHLGNGYRQFNPVLMRFNSPDSWSPFGEGGLNAYAYCAGNPISKKDPSGHVLVKAMLFDEIFSNSYLLTKSPDLGKAQLLNSVQKTVNRFGGEEHLKILANANKNSPDAIIARAIPRPKKITQLEDFKVGEDPEQFLYKSDRQIRKTLKNRNISEEILKSENGYTQHLSESELRNWKLDRRDNQLELERVISNILRLRTAGPSRFSDSFNADDWLTVVSRIRSS
ncbi:hypothetical protein C1886_14105 [Pseudomonas sp. FW300-N1A1]|uniref:RHS repeat-associated core domain-containing protein n=1 Tax=Pseudomonas sp. FW300-N1A1 TaxID=2075555 RepID=UPI000CD073BD|nr:RHS repeat-associated core domain-containing protein [Pseudomonas sp. FW300-N1A1]POA19081.1 hypothetical protein C1886_14105 [Pseudomonas sp. FW300-N1A1]